jgi:hypothetical protein
VVELCQSSYFLPIHESQMPSSEIKTNYFGAAGEWRCIIKRRVKRQ